MSPTSYEYDSAGQLKRENNQAAGKTWVYTYDKGGNIVSKKEYAYTTGTLGTPTSTKDYTYDTVWGDLLTAYNGATVTSDDIGNTLYDGTRTYTWEHGRQLATLRIAQGAAWNFTYDANGMRTHRTDGTDHYSYVYNGSQLTQVRRGNDIVDIAYADGKPMSLTLNNDTSYFYVTNLQGDVIALMNTSGRLVVKYTYDAWGRLLSTYDNTGKNLWLLNPLRYRGYVYDDETGLYYLQSRYYDPAIGRFINADAYASTGVGILGNNMFAYCNNNPVSFADSSGQRMVCVACAPDGGGGTTLDYVIYYYHPESSENLDDPAKRNHSTSDSIFVAAGSFGELADAINEVPGNTDDVFIYMHSDETELSFYYAQYYSAENIKESINEIDIYGDIYLFSCKGGRGNLASSMASATNCTVIASVYKVSFDQGLARCGWENYFWDSRFYGLYSWYSFSPDGNKEPYSIFFISTQ